MNPFEARRGRAPAIVPKANQRRDGAGGCAQSLTEGMRPPEMGANAPAWGAGGRMPVPQAAPGDTDRTHPH